MLYIAVFFIWVELNCLCCAADIFNCIFLNEISFLYTKFIQCCLSGSSLEEISISVEQVLKYPMALKESNELLKYRV